MMPLPKPKNLGKALSSRSRHSEPEEDFDLEDEAEEEADLGSTDAGDDILRQMGINLESEPPNYVLTSGAIKGVSIRTYDVGGYVLEDVHQFHERVLETVKWYGQALHQRDLDVHRLATELDRSQTDYINQKFQIELLRGQTGKALVNEDGSYVTQSQLNEDPTVALQVANAKITELTRQYDADQEQIRVLNEGLEQFQVYANELEERQAILEHQLEQALATGSQEAVAVSTPEVVATSAPLDDAERQQLNNLLAWAAEVEIEYTKMEERVAELTSENSNLKNQPAVAVDTSEVEELRQTVADLTQQVADSQTYSGELNTYVERLQAHIEELNEYIAQLSTDVENAEGEHDEGSEDGADESVSEAPEAPARPSSYAPELPEGVILPSQQRRHRPSEFAPASPGAPLTSISEEDLEKYL